ncbi:hypothetical protein HLH33_08880 [Gluconacetobacter diazotrophicus]|uniref:Uncharacterized protein n=2 Tax=Gluconacetobacter diazotrophicus TaxID=33996 RepID=A0A7W4I4X2_GLUDI|nr:hypothetical protein [Gluconacetobacter diazotrophicus]
MPTPRLTARPRRDEMRVPPGDLTTLPYWLNARRDPMDVPVDTQMNRLSAGRRTGRTVLAILAVGTALAVVAPPVQAAPKHHAGAQTAQTGGLNAPISTNLGTTNLGNSTAARPADPRVDPDNPPAPPPPDGYQVVQDEDVSVQAYSPRVTAIQGPGLPSIEARQTPRRPNDVPSHFSVFGVPVKFDAPVQPPYNASFMYSTYAGQPGRGIDAIGAEGAAGEP